MKESSKELSWFIVKFCLWGIIIWYLMFLCFGCCPRVIESSNTIVRTDTIYRDTTIFIPEHNELFDIDFNTICDSLSKMRGVRENRTPVQILKPVLARTHSSAIIKFDSTGIGKVLCHEDSLRIQLNKANMEIQTMKETVKTEVTNICDNAWHKFTSWAFPVLAALILLAVGFILKKNFI